MNNYVFNFSQALIVFKKPFLLYSKMKNSWSSNSSGVLLFFIHLFIFFWRFAHVLSLTISTKVCAEYFFIVLQFENIKENWKRSGTAISRAIIFKGLWWCPSARYVEEIRPVNFSIIVKLSLKKLLYLIITLIQSGNRGAIPTFVTPTFLKLCSSSSKVHSWNAA